ncbi:MAG TPA: DUF948 domain-containing protein [Acidimicrobiales bacterium]|jgi:uncharacterized protein YoxC
MSASDVAAVIVAITSVVAVTLLVIALGQMTRTLRQLRETLDELRRETIPVVENLQVATQKANTDLERVEQLLTTAESIGATVDSASRLAYLTFSNPVIKTMAAASGTARAYRRLRRSSD